MRKSLIIISIISIFFQAFAEEVLFDFGSEKKVEPKKTEDAPKPKPTVKTKKKVKASTTTTTAVEVTEETGNLPTYYVNRDMKQVTKQESSTTLPNTVKQMLESVVIGDTFDAVIDHSIIAFNDEKAPLLGRITSGKLKGYKIVGQAALNDASKTAFMDFTALSKAGQSYVTKAQAVTELGHTGFTGNYESNERGLFAGTFIAAFVAAYFDGLVPRETNFFGQVQQDTSVQSAINKGMAGASIETANMFREKLKNAKSFIEIKGPIKFKIVIQDTVTEK